MESLYNILEDNPNEIGTFLKMYKLQKVTQDNMTNGGDSVMLDKDNNPVNKVIQKDGYTMTMGGAGGGTRSRIEHLISKIK